MLWAEDRAAGPVSDGGRQRLVIARDSGEVTLWPALPVGEVIRRYEEEYGAGPRRPRKLRCRPPRMDLGTDLVHAEPAGVAAGGGGPGWESRTAGAETPRRPWRRPPRPPPALPGALRGGARPRPRRPRRVPGRRP